jgi:hypothetical protein
MRPLPFGAPKIQGFVEMLVADGTFTDPKGYNPVGTCSGYIPAVTNLVSRTIGLCARDRSNNFPLPLCFLIETLAHPNTGLPFRYLNGTSRILSSLIDCISTLLPGQEACHFSLHLPQASRPLRMTERERTIG